MPTNSRRGLQRAGMRSWSVTGPRGRYIIHREKRSEYRVRPDGWHVTFYLVAERLLRDARFYAETYAGLR